MNFNNIKNGKYKDLQIIYDAEEKQYFLSAKYEYENDNGKYLLEIPKVYLDNLKEPIINMKRLDFGCYYTEWDIDFGLDTKISSTDRRYPDEIYTVTEIEKKYTEMTLEEIEAKLGKNIKIVSNKENK